MTGSIIVINVDIRETRVALIEDGVIAELLLERAAHRSTVGDVVLGKVTRVLPGMQAAFIDVGHDRSAFLHVEDLIRPDDFDRYLAEGGARTEGVGPAWSDGEAPLAGGEPEEAVDEEEAAAAMRRATRRRRRGRGGPSEDWEGGPPPGDQTSSDTQAPSASAGDQAPERHGRRRKGRGSEVGGERRRRPEPGAVDGAGASREEAADPHLGEVPPVGQEAPLANGPSKLLSAGAGPSARGAIAGLNAVDSAAAGPTAVVARPFPAGELVDELKRGPADDARSAFDGGGSFGAESLDEESLDEESLDAESLDEESLDEESLDDDGNEGLAQEEAADPVEGDDSESDEDHESDDDASERDDNEDDEPTDTESETGRDQSNRRRASAVAASRASERSEAVGPAERMAAEGGRAAPEPRPRGEQSRRPGRNSESRSARGGAARAGRAPAPLSRRSRGRGGKDKTRPNGVRGRGGESSTPARVSRSVPITEVVKEGDSVVVQISKEPIGTKGARVTSHVSLPGRYVVYLPTVDHLGVSKRIGHSRERSRLRKAMESLKPARGGLIVRTVAEGLTKKQLKADVGYLIRVWSEICRKHEQAKPPAELYTELDLLLKVARDLFTDEVQRIVIDDREQYGRLCRFVEMFLPERVKDIELYTGEDLIFDAYGIEDEIARSLGRKVPLPSGGSLIVDQAEALTAIDVNTGRYVGKGSKDLEETALKTNLEAVEEIAYQLRFRNIGGLVILDLIDMDRASNREKVWRALESALVKDKAKTTLNRISDLGLVEMTRKRTRDSLGRTLHEPCFYCDGTGQVQSKQTIAYEIMRQIGRERQGLPGYSVVVNAHPAVVDLLRVEEPGALAEAERRYTRRIELVPRAEYHLEQYDIHGK